MNDSDLLRREARAQRDRENAAKLASLGITPAEASLFNVIHYGISLAPEYLPDRATYPDYSIGGEITLDVAEAAMSGCFDKDWLQVIDEAALCRIRQEIRDEGRVGPVYGYPSVGRVDFTHKGAEQWFRVVQHLWNGGPDESFAFTDVVRLKTSYYYQSEKKAIIARNHWKEREYAVVVSDPIQMGPWRANWWRRFPVGYRIDVEERMQWEGRYSDGGGSMYFQHRDLRCNHGTARNVLDDYDMQWAEWVILYSLEHVTQWYRIAHWATEFSRQLGLDLTEADCQKGLESCLCKEWLRPVDDETIAEVETLLSSDTAIMPVPYKQSASRYGIDFTPQGAELYRKVSTRIFGPEWEHHLEVEFSYYREEHRYCATESGCRVSAEKYDRTDETPQTTRTVPIGPWCVFWWKRFPSGYRMELTFGDEHCPLQSAPRGTPPIR